MKKMLIRTALFSALATTSLSAVAADKTALLDKIRSQSSQYSEFKALLTSPDQSVRFAAFDAMYNSGDAILKELAIDEALAYPDATLQSLAFKEIIMGLDTLTFQLKAAEGADEETKSLISSWGHTASYKLNQKDRISGVIQQCENTSTCTGQVSGLELTIRQRKCNVVASLEESAQLKGTLSCDGLMPIDALASLK